MLKNNTNIVMLFFAVISLILVYMMINSFKIIDCCYFLVVVLFATRYLCLSRN